MTQGRFQRTGKGSFYGEYLYDRIVPQDHFLRKLRELVPWQKFDYKLLKYYRGKAKTGRPPIEPCIVLKMLILSYLYDLSERQTEAFCNENLPAKYFLGLAIDEPAPDHSTLSAFKRRILENGRITAFQTLLQAVVLTAQEAGVEFGPIQIIDSTHSIADVNTQKDERRQARGHYPRDPNARWGVKHSYKVRDEQGKEHTRVEYFYGDKAHISFNEQAQMITNLIVSPGNRPDGGFLPDLVKLDLALGLDIDTVVADRAYDDSDNHFLLESLGIHNAINLRKIRTEKKDRNKQVWLELKAQPWYASSLAKRYAIERKFGEAKKHHGLGRCRYLGLIRYAVQAYLTAIALNLKRLVRLLTGVPFRAPVYA
jgi:IS5 family transposase